MLKRFCCLYRVLLCLAVIGFPAMEAGAAEYTVTPSLKLRETYDDNVFFKGDDDFEHLASPALEIGVRKDTSALNVSCGWEISKYAQHNELDTVDQAYGLSTKAFLNPLLQIGLSGEYVADYTFVSALEESGLLAERTKRKRGTLGPSVILVLDPRNTLRGDSLFEKTQYQSDRYSDYWMEGFNVTWTHALLEKQTGVIFEAGAYLVDFDRPDEDLRQYVYRGLAGFEHRLTETVIMTFKAGGSHTKSDFRESNGRSDQEDSGFVLNGSVEWKGERMSLSADISRDLTPSIDEEIIIRDRVRSGLGYRFTEKLRGNLSGAYYRSKTQRVLEDKKRHTFVVHPSMAYGFTKDIALLLGYGYTWSENEVTSDTKDRNRVFLELSMAWPRQY